MFGVEAMSPGRTGRNNFEVHHVCRDLGFTHMEGLVNLDQLVGKGRFRFIGFPLKIKGGSGSPIRAGALLDDEWCGRGPAPAAMSSSSALINATACLLCCSA